MTRLSQARILRTLRRAPYLCVLPRTKSLPNLLSLVSPILSLVSQFPQSSAVPYRTASATFITVVSAHSISIGPASAANTGGFLLTA
jgi:hypothetical protein